MYYPLVQIAIMSFLLLSFANCNETCNLSDSPCVTSAAQSKYNLLLSEEPINPLHYTKLEGKILRINFVLHNPILKGFKSCNVHSITFKTTENMYENVLKCPHFNLSTNYSANGVIMLFNRVDQEGYLEISTDETTITINGKYGLEATEKSDSSLPNEENKHTYINIKSNDITIEFKENIHFEKIVVSKGQQTQADEAKAFFDGTGSGMAKQQVTQWFQKFTSLFVEYVKDFLKHHTIEELLAKN